MINILLLVSALITQTGDYPEPLRFGFYLEGDPEVELSEVFEQCLENDITCVEKSIPLNELLFQGNYSWCWIDSLVSSAHEASVNDPEHELTLILAIAGTEMPGWCRFPEYGPYQITMFCEYKHFDLITDFFGRLAERYRPGGVLAQEEGWNDSWGVNHFNIFGESDLTWRPCGWNNGGWYHLDPDDRDQEGFVEVFCSIRQAIVLENPDADVSISFMGQPYREAWPKDPLWPTGIGADEFDEYMDTLFSCFEQSGYYRYPDGVDWHIYPACNDPLCYGGRALWESSFYPWFENASLSARSIEYEDELEEFGFDNTWLAVYESGASPYWPEIQRQYRTIEGHVSFQLSALAEAAASNRTWLVEFDTNIDDVTACPDVTLPDDYCPDLWWNDTYEEIDLLFEAYARMAGLLEGTYLEDIVVSNDGLDTEIIVHEFHDPEDDHRVYQIRSALPDPLGSDGIPNPFDQIVNCRYVSIVPAIGSQVMPYDCGPTTPYVVHLSDVDWSIRWIVENPTRETEGEGATAARIIPESMNPTRDVFRASIIGLETDSDYCLDVFDVSGRIVRRQPIRCTEAGSTSVSVDAHDLPNGVYVVLLEDSDCVPVSFTLLK